MGTRACRLCHEDRLEEFLDLGFSPPEDAFLQASDLNRPETWYPLSVSVCQQCGFAQLTHVIPLEAKFGAQYVYDTAATPAGVRHFQQFAKDVGDSISLAENDLVVDIGSNTGVLLKAFQEVSRCLVVGVDPAPIVAEIANDQGIRTYVEPFSPLVAERINREHGLAKLVTGTNVFAHIDDLDAVMDGIDSLLDPQGVFVFESPHFLRLVENLEYDTIYHGHVSYISLKPLIEFFRRFGMEVFNVVEPPIHGGSIRVFIGRRGKNRVAGIVSTLIGQEESAKIHQLSYLRDWAKEVAEHRQALRKLLLSLKLQGKRIVGVGAPAKSTTLLTYAQIGTEVLDYVTDANPLKVGRFTPGQHIPIKSDDFFLEDRPDYALVLAWNFGREIMAKLAAYQKSGGKFVVPIPKPRIVKGI